MFLGYRLAGGSVISGLAFEYFSWGTLWSHCSSYGLHWSGPAGRSVDGGGEPGPKVCPEHEARQTTVLRPRGLKFTLKARAAFKVF